MANFTYRAKQGPAKIVEGRVEAETLDGAIAKILQKGLTPLNVQGTGGRSVSLQKKKKSRTISFVRRIPVADIALFTRQMSDLVDAGVPLMRAITVVERQTKHQMLRGIITRMQAVVRDGGSLSDALGKFPAVFNRLYVNMVRSGELGGNLNVVLNRLADFIEKDQDVRGQVRNALLYPGFILCVGVGAIFFLLAWAVPKITLIFDDLGQTLPLPTIILLAVSDFLARYGWLLILAFAGGGIYLSRMLQTPHGRRWWDSMVLRLIVIGPLIKDSQIGRFARTLGTLLGNGVPLVSALQAVVLVVDNTLLQEDIRRVTEEVTNGASLAGALSKNSLFPEAAVSMISVGEESGRTADGLAKLANYYERQTQSLIKGGLSLLGPVLILIIGLVVFFVVFALLMPIFQMNLVVT